jgi:hypothetical protein
MIPGGWGNHQFPRRQVVSNEIHNAMTREFLPAGQESGHIKSGHMDGLSLS